MIIAFPRDQRYKKSVTEKRSYKVIHLGDDSPRRYVSPLPFLCLSDCAETTQAHYPTLRERKWRKTLTASVSIILKT